VVRIVQFNAISPAAGANMFNSNITIVHLREREMTD